MSIKVIHAADIHLDSPFSGSLETGKSEVRREDVRASFQNIINMAKNADFLFLSGDLFDGNNVSRTTLEFLKNQFALLSPVRVFIVAGNHDARQTNSIYNTFDFGENVHVFGTEPTCVKTDIADIYGVSFFAANEERKLLPEFTVENEEKINLLVLHGNLSGEGYHPITLTEIANSKMDYIALGHIHAYSGLKKSGNTFYAYPGCPEGRGFDETGEKGVLALEIAKGAVRETFVPVSTRMYLDETVDVSGCKTYDEIAERVATIYKGNQHIYRIHLKGVAEFPIDTNVVASKIDAFSIEVRDETKASFDIEKASREFTLKGLFLRYALEERDELSQEEFDLALKTGLSLIEKEERNENR